MVKIAYVEWEDARGISAPRSMESMSKVRPLVLHSAGILLSADEVAVRLAQDTWDAEEEAVSRDMEIIPRRNVLRMQTWEVRDASKAKPSKSRGTGPRLRQNKPPAQDGA